MFVNEETMNHIHLFFFSGPTEYVDDRVSVGAHGRARAPATDFSAHLIVQSLDKLYFLCNTLCTYSVSMIIMIIGITNNGLQNNSSTMRILSRHARWRYILGAVIIL